MSTKHLLRISRLSLGLLILLSTINFNLSTFAQGSAFTYQGRLDTGGAPVNGTYDLVFSVWASASGAKDVFGFYTNSATPVSNGLFTVSADFGAFIFSGDDRWLRIDVRTNGPGLYTPLSPRQKLTPTPYAMTALNVSSGGFGGIFTNPVTFNNPANSYCGDGSCLTNVSATTLGGLTSADFWRLNGNIVGATNFLGTLNNFPLEVKVNNNHALRIVPASVPSLEGGYFQNSTHGSSSAAIVGGGSSGSINEVFGNYGFVGAGHGAKAGGFSAVIGGGYNVAPGQFSFVGTGLGNNNLADYSFIGSGTNNYIVNSATYSYIGGGAYNVAASPWDVVAGGYSNSVSGVYATCSGGLDNIVANFYATVSGGYFNQASGPISVIGGGEINTASGYLSTIGGGFLNVAGKEGTTVAGGEFNTASGYRSTVAGGASNQATNQYAVVGGGLSNTAGGRSAAVGGESNTGLADYSVIGGGHNNHITSDAINSFVGAGFNNSASGTTTTIGGGGNNIADVNGAAITGGSENHAGGDHSFIGGGQGNAESAAYATIGGGYVNSASGMGATIGGGGYDGVNVSGNNAAGAGSFIGGGIGNTIQTDSLSSTISGGKNNAVNNFDSAPAPYAVIAGGEANTIWPYLDIDIYVPGDHSVIGGGYSNSLWSSESVIAGGVSNVIQGGLGSVISGGANNQINFGRWATIAGGEGNEANGTWSFAAGQHAKALHPGTFVWADSQSAYFASSAGDQFSIRAQGGIQLSPTTSVFCGNQTRQMLNLWGTQYGIGVQNLTTYFRCDNASSTAGFSWFKGGVHNNNQNNPGGGIEMMRLNGSGLTVNGTFVSASDRNLKENFRRIDSRDVLERVASMPVSTWNYKTDPESRHLGPMAQDFYAAFGVGPDDKHITTIDESGVALAAIQGLNEKVEAENSELRSENLQLKQRLERLEKLVLEK